MVKSVKTNHVLALFLAKVHSIRLKLVDGCYIMIDKSYIKKKGKENEYKSEKVV